MRLSILFAVNLGFASVLTAPTALADPALDTFNEGLRLLRAGDEPGACAKFTESVTARPTVGALGRVAECEEHRQHLRAAGKAWRAALALAEEKQDDRLEAVRAAVARLEGSTPRLRVLLPATPPPGLVVRLDGEPWKAEEEEQAVDPGLHVLDASAPGRRPYEHRFELRAGRITEVAVPPLASDGPELPAEGTVAPSASTTTRPPIPTPSQTPPAGTALASVRVRAIGPDAVTLHEVTNTSFAVGAAGTAVGFAFRGLCTAPCATTLAPGSYQFAVSQGEGLPIAVLPRITVPNGASTLVAHYDSHAGTRTWGRVLFGVGLLGSMATALTGLGIQCSTGDCTMRDVTTKTALFSSVGALLLAGLVGVPFLFVSDKARVEILPGVQGAVRGTSGGAVREGDVAARAGSTAGASLRVTF